MISLGRISTRLAKNWPSLIMTPPRSMRHGAEAAGVIEVALQRRPIGPLAPAEIADEHIPPERGDEDAKPEEDDAIAALAELSGTTSRHGSG